MDILKAFIGFLTFFSLRYAIVSFWGYYWIWIRNKNVAEKYRIQKVDFRKRDLHREIKYSLLTAIQYALIHAAIFSPSVRPYLKVYDGAYDYGLLWLLLSLPVMMVLHDTYFYWAHRLMHHPRIYKHVHLVHHRSTNPSFFATQAFHPTEAFFEIIWILPVFIFMPLNFYVYLIFTVISGLLNAVGHSGLEVLPPSQRKNPVLRFFNSSTHHNDHHRYPSATNLGLYFTFWDRLMGTERNY